MQIPPELNVPALFDFPQVFALYCKVAMKHYLYKIDSERRHVPPSAEQKLSELYYQVYDACPHCQKLYAENLEREAAQALYKSVYGSIPKPMFYTSSPDASQPRQNLQISDLTPQSLVKVAGIQGKVDQFNKAYQAFQKDQSEQALKKCGVACTELNNALRENNFHESKIFQLEQQTDLIMSKIKTDLELKDQLIRDKFTSNVDSYHVADERPLGEVEDIDGLKKLLRYKDYQVQQLRNEMRVIRKNQLFKPDAVAEIDRQQEMMLQDELAQERQHVQQLEEQNTRLQERLKSQLELFKDKTYGGQAIDAQLRQQNEVLKQENCRLEAQLRKAEAERDIYLRQSKELQQSLSVLNGAL